MERSSLLIVAACLALAPVLLPSLGVAQPPDASWRLVREGEHVFVYTREVDGSQYVESLARTTVESRLSTLVSLIMDARSHPRWIDSIDEARQLEAVSPTEVYNYTLSGAPWPVADRDAVVLTRLEQDPSSLVVTIRSTAKPDHIPPRDGVVRVPQITSSWTLAPQANGAVEVTYRVHNDPGGELPGWLTNSLASDQPFNTLENLRTFLSTDTALRDAALPYITEPGS